MARLTADPTTCNQWSWTREMSGRTRDRSSETSAWRELQAVERTAAGVELVDFDPQPLEHTDVEVAQRRRVLRIERQVLAVLEATPRDEDGQVPVGVAAGVSQVAPQIDRRPVEQSFAPFLRLLQLGHQLAQDLHAFDLDQLQLR